MTHTTTSTTYDVADHVHTLADWGKKLGCGPSIHDEAEREPFQLTEWQKAMIDDLLKMFERTEGTSRLVWPYIPHSINYSRHVMERERLAQLDRFVTYVPAPMSSTIHTTLSQVTGRSASKTVVFDIESYDPSDRWASEYATLYGTDGWTGERKTCSAFYTEFDPADIEWPVTLVAPTGRAARLINEKLGKEAATSAPQIEVPKDFKPKATKPNNRAERRRAGRKERDHAERHIPR